MENIGHDGSGVHCGISDVYKTVINSKRDVVFEEVEEENLIAVERIKEFYKSQKKPFAKRLVNKISRAIIGKNILQ